MVTVSAAEAIGERQWQRRRRQRRCWWRRHPEQACVVAPCHLPAMEGRGSGGGGGGGARGGAVEGDVAEVSGAGVRGGIICL